MKAAILQSNYIPWRGYFDLVAAVDVFVFHDDLQYTKNDWRNRNRIMLNNNSVWLSIPCGASESRLINEVRVDRLDWQKKHFETLRQAYRKARFWDYCLPLLEFIYLEKSWSLLSDLNQQTIKVISYDYLGIETVFEKSESYDLEKKKADRVLELLGKIGATEYVSGPSATNYLDPNKFTARSIGLKYFDYSGLKNYPQLGGSFTDSLSIIDLLMNVGPKARDYLTFDGRSRECL